MEDGDLEAIVDPFVNSFGPPLERVSKATEELRVLAGQEWFEMYDPQRFEIVVRSQKDGATASAVVEDDNGSSSSSEPPKGKAAAAAAAVPGMTATPTDSQKNAPFLDLVYRRPDNTVVTNPYVVTPFTHLGWATFRYGDSRHDPETKGEELYKKDTTKAEWSMGFNVKAWDMDYADAKGWDTMTARWWEWRGEMTRRIVRLFIQHALCPRRLEVVVNVFKAVAESNSKARLAERERMYENISKKHRRKPTPEETKEYKEAIKEIEDERKKEVDPLSWEVVSEFIVRHTVDKLKRRAADGSFYWLESRRVWRDLAVSEYQEMLRTDTLPKVYSDRRDYLDAPEPKLLHGSLEWLMFNSIPKKVLNSAIWVNLDGSPSNIPFPQRVMRSGSLVALRLSLGVYLHTPQYKCGWKTTFENIFFYGVVAGSQRPVGPAPLPPAFVGLIMEGASTGESATTKPLWDELDACRSQFPKITMELAKITETREKMYAKNNKPDPWVAALQQLKRVTPALTYDSSSSSSSSSSKDSFHTPIKDKKATKDSDDDNGFGSTFTPGEFDSGFKDPKPPSSSSLTAAATAVVSIATPERDPVVEEEAEESMKRQVEQLKKKGKKQTTLRLTPVKKRTRSQSRSRSVTAGGEGEMTKKNKEDPADGDGDA